MELLWNCENVLDTKYLFDNPEAYLTNTSCQNIANSEQQTEW